MQRCSLVLLLSLLSCDYLYSDLNKKLFFIIYIHTHHTPKSQCGFNLDYDILKLIDYESLTFKMVHLVLIKPSDVDFYIVFYMRGWLFFPVFVLRIVKYLKKNSNDPGCMHTAQNIFKFYCMAFVLPRWASERSRKIP